MNFDDLYAGPLIDGHVHFWGGDDLEGSAQALMRLMERVHVAKFNLMATLDPFTANRNPSGLYCKARFPDRVYLFGGLDHFSMAGEPTEAAAADLATQVDRLRAMGCDGVKMIEGKPTVYRSLPIPFDGPLYADFFARLEATAFPVLMHVNDPETFWTLEGAPDWARGRGWLYDESYPTKESLYGQIANVLARHPRLVVIFAHFYFLGADLVRAGQLLDRYPNIYLDLTPGSEMYHQFSVNPQEARSFFAKYADRIIFGTDSSDRAAMEEEERIRTVGKFWMVRHFLETEDGFDAETVVQRPGWVQGIALPDEILAKIYQTNLERVIGARPARLDLGQAIAECNRLADMYDRGEPLHPEFARSRTRPESNVPRQVAEWLSREAVRT